MYSLLTSLCNLFYLYILLVNSKSIAQQPTFEEIQQHYDTQNVNDSQIRSALALNVEPNNGGSARRCQDCINIDQQKSRRIEMIKNKIKRALNLDVLGLPNITDRRVPQVPSYQRLRERYELENNVNVQSDSPYSYRSIIEDEEEEYGRPERTYAFAREVPASTGVLEPNAVYFDIPSLTNKEITKALIWVYIRSSSTRLANNITEIYLYSMVSPGKRGGPPIRNYIMKRKRGLRNSEGWHHFDITGLVMTWVRHPSRNLGIVVEAMDIDGNNMIVLPPTSGDEEGFEPNLDVKTRTPLHGHRSRRSVNLDCNDENQYEACCRYPLVVDFVEFGWDFVIAPNRYASYYCAGECQNEHMDNTPQSRLMQEVDQSQINASKSGPCCTPTRMSNLAMLYFDQNQSVQFTTLPKMKVERCGCQ